MLESICVACGRIIKFEEEHLGRTFKCPSCGQTNIVKRISIVEEIDSQISDEAVLISENMKKAATNIKRPPSNNKHSGDKIAIIIMVGIVIIGLLALLSF